jgi:hypothetical protein
LGCGWGGWLGLQLGCWWLSRGVDGWGVEVESASCRQSPTPPRPLSRNIKTCTHATLAHAPTTLNPSHSHTVNRASPTPPNQPPTQPPPLPPKRSDFERQLAAAESKAAALDAARAEALALAESAASELVADRTHQLQREAAQRSAEAALASKAADAGKELMKLRAQAKAAEEELAARQRDVGDALEAAREQLEGARGELVAAHSRAEAEGAAREEAGKRLAAVRIGGF